MKASIFTLLLVLGPALGEDFCKEELRMSVDVEDAVLQKNGTLLTGESDPYPAGTFWKGEEEGHWWVCPCLLGNCIRICEGDFIEKIIESYNGTVLPVLWEEIIEKDTPPIESFKQVNSAECDRGYEILNKEDVRILANGKMRLNSESKLYDAENYCVHQMEEKNSIHVVHCRLASLELKETTPTAIMVFDFIFVAYWVLQFTNTLRIEIIYLILTVEKYRASQQIKSFHGKSVLCYLACLAVNSTVLTVNAIFNNIFGLMFKKLCILIGFIHIYTNLASLFWLNTMCLDIFFTYKGISRTGKYYFAKFAIYSFCAPIAIVAVTLYFNLINDENSSWNPNIGDDICTINGKAPVWIYYRGPSLFIILVNIGILSATYCKSGEPVRTTEETDQTETQENIYRLSLSWFLENYHLLFATSFASFKSIRTTEETDQTVPQEKERRRTYLMLTLLACFTIIIDIIPIPYRVDVGALIILNIMTNIFSCVQRIIVYALIHTVHCRLLRVERETGTGLCPCPIFVFRVRHCPVPVPVSS